MLALNKKIQMVSNGLPQWLQWRADLIPGLVLCAVLSAGAMLLDRVPWLQAHGLSALTLAIVLGFIVGNTIFAKMSGYCAPGVPSPDISRYELCWYGGGIN